MTPRNGMTSPMRQLRLSGSTKDYHEALRFYAMARPASGAGNCVIPGATSQRFCRYSA
jgi:hypothetical protein